MFYFLWRECFFDGTDISVVASTLVDSFGCNVLIHPTCDSAFAFAIEHPFFIVVN